MAHSIKTTSFPRHSRISIAAVLRRALNLLDLQRSRRALARLDKDALRDIGISKAEADKEAQKPFWDAPEHWIK